jgi:pRiA4b ORF-3-like protein
LHDVLRHVLGWSGELGYSFRIHGQEFNNFRRRSRSRPLRDFRFHRQEKRLYLCDFLDLWEWDLRVLDIQEGLTEDPEPLCLGGRGAAPPECCGGPCGYRLMLKRQQQGAAVNELALVEATLQLLTTTHPGQPASAWNLLWDAVQQGWQSVDRRLEYYEPLEPQRFSLLQANERLAAGLDRGRMRL